MQQHGTKYFALRQPDPGDEASRSKFTFFSEYGHIEYQFKGNQKMQQKGSKYLPADAYPLTPTLGMGSVGQNSTFSEHGHVAYQN